MNTILEQSAAPQPGSPLGASARPLQALIKEARRRARRRRLAGGVVVAAVLLVTAVVALAVMKGTASPRPGQRHLPARPGQAVAAVVPPQVVVWTAYGRIEVRSSRTGRLIRTLATNVAVIRGLPVLALTPSGTLFFDHYRRTHDEILSMPLTGGPRTVVAQYASKPAVSPEGRLLAYVTNTDGSSAPEAIVVRNLVSGAERRWTFATQGRADVAAMSWSPDGRSLSFTLDSAQAGVFYAGASSWVLDTSQPSGSLDPGGVPGASVSRDRLRASIRPIPLRGRLSWAGYLTARTGIAAREGYKRAALFLVDVTTGRIVRRLVSLHTELGYSNVSDGPEGTIQADPTGRNLLISANGPKGDGELYWWAPGMRRVAPIVGGVDKAIWVGAG